MINTEDARRRITSQKDYTAPEDWAGTVSHFTGMVNGIAFLLCDILDELRSIRAELAKDQK